MPDIVVTWGLDRGEFWDYDVTDEEIANEWGPWKLITLSMYSSNDSNSDPISNYSLWR